MSGDVYGDVCRHLFEATNGAVNPLVFAELTPGQVRALFGRPRRTFRSTNDAIRDYEARKAKEGADARRDPAA